MEISYIYFAFSAFFNAVISTFLGLLIFFRDRKDKNNKTFALFCLGVALWSFAYVLWPLVQTKELSLLSFRLLHVPACFVSIFYLHFVVNWLDLYKKKRLVIWVGYILSFFFASFTFTNAYIQDMVPKFGMRYWAEPGMLYHYYLLMFFGLFLYSSYLLVKEFYRNKDSVRKQQIKLVLFGIVLSFLGGSTNYFLWYNINIPPYGNILGSSFVIFTAYAIIRYKLLNIKLIATEGSLLIMNMVLLFRFLVSRGLAEFLVNILILIFSLIFSLILIKSVKKEIKRREEVSRLAHSLEKANIRLQELDRQKTDFLSIAAHQLRTPLSIMKGYIELIQDGAYGKISIKANNVLNDMDSSNERLVKLVDEFLDITRIEQGRTKFNFAYHNLNELITGTVKELKEKADEKKMKIVWKAAKSIKRAWVDDEKIRHVIFNYIDNAIKYSEKSPVKVTIEREQNGITLRVKDKGLGFNKVDQANFFQKFYRGINVKGTNVNGTGLGIYVCRKFIEKHGGHVWAHSQGVGKGSEFGFWIPGKKK